MEPITSTILLKAMDCLSSRMTAIAENIANSNTANYRPVHVNFEAALREAATLGIGAVDSVQPEFQRESSGGIGSGGRIDMELAASAVTRERYGALAELLGREMLIASLATTGGHG